MVKHESERFTLYCADAADVLDSIEAKSVGLIATDPPYGVKWQSGKAGGRFKPIVNDDGSYDAIAVVGAHVRHALKPSRHVYVFGPSHLAVRERLSLGGSCDLVWDKGCTGMGDLGLPWGPQHEVCAFGVFEPSKAHRGKGYGGLSARLRQGSVLSIPRLGSRGLRHPTEKPVELMRRLIESSSVTNDVVLDMFAGSGSTLVAAILCGRKAVGIEVAAEHYETALARCIAAESLWRAGLAA